MLIKYSKDHEWIRLEDDGTATIGITDHAQKQLGDVVFVELPVLGLELTQGGNAAVVESVKAASEVYAPISGAVVAINQELEADPALINRAPEGDGWFMKMKMTDKAQLDTLMDKSAYDAFTATL